MARSQHNTTLRTNLSRLPADINQVWARSSLKERPDRSFVSAMACEIQRRSPLVILHVRIGGNLTRPLGRGAPRSVFSPGWLYLILPWLTAQRTDMIRL